MSLSVVVDGVGWGRTGAFVCLITPPASSSSSTAAVSSLALLRTSALSRIVAAAVVAAGVSAAGAGAAAAVVAVVWDGGTGRRKVRHDRCYVHLKYQNCTCQKSSDTDMAVKMSVTDIKEMRKRRRTWRTKEEARAGDRRIEQNG